MSKQLEFIEENGKHYKLETYKQQIDLSELPKQVVWLQNMINAKKDELKEMEDDLKKVLKLQNDKKIS